MEPLVIYLMIGVACGALASAITIEKGWNNTNWFLAGFLFGPLGLLAAAGMPDRRSQKYLRYLAMQQGWSSESSNDREMATENPQSADEQRRRILG